MASDHSGTGDPRRSVELLWGVDPKSGKGPRPRLSILGITTSAVALADEDGLDGLSMRRLAQRLDVAPMNLYAYVPGKAELLDLMVDRVSGEVLEEPLPAGWRAGLRALAHSNWSLYVRHPWLLSVSTVRAPLGPNTLAKYERELSVIDGIGLSDVAMDSVLSLVLGHVASVSRRVADAADAVRRSGLTDLQWWERSAPALAEVVDAAQFPVASRVGTASGRQHGAASDAAVALEFGLERILDGVAALLAR
jgi:AcrR family transcriptional regulator